MPLTQHFKKKQSDRQKQIAHPLAIRDLEGHPSIKVFIQQYKVAWDTIRRIRTEPIYTEWIEKLKRKQARVLGEEFKEFTLTTKGKLREYADEAPKILFGIMMDEAEKAPARIAAATEIMDRDG